MTQPLIMTPGPTYVHEDVRKALGQEITNPDIDLSFYDFYQETCQRLQRLMKTEEDVLILSGEGILGLEAACASLIEPRDRILCLDNGIFGNGFGDLAKMYGGDVTYFKTDYRRGISPQELEVFLEKDHDFKIATLVHCETPSGITNPVEQICPILKRYGIVTVVDSVSAIGGEEIQVDQWQMDVVLGGSQKCISAPPGLTFLSISTTAWNMILNRHTPIIGYYANLSLWKDWYQKKWFPYTQPISDLYGFKVAIERVLANDFINRHARIAKSVQDQLLAAGLELYPLDSRANTVTTLMLPEGVRFKAIYDKMLHDYGIMIAGSFGHLEDKVIRIGHMGENCYEDKVERTLKALQQTFVDLR